MSEMANLSPAYISRVESGDIEPSARALSSVILALRLTPMEALLILHARNLGGYMGESFSQQDGNLRRMPDEGEV